MGLNKSVQQFVEQQTLNDLNRYLLYFLEEHPKQLVQDEIIEIWIKPRLEILSGMNVNIDIFEMSYEKLVTYFRHLENLEKIKHTNGPDPDTLSVNNEKKSFCCQYC
jgi:hypothetical protein